MKRLTVKNLNVKYRYGALAVSDLTFFAEKGVTCILGAEESGKTSLLKAIAGLIKPISGEVYFDETPSEQLRLRDRNVCLIYEDGGFFERKTALYNLQYPLKVRKTTEMDMAQAIEAATEIVGFKPEDLNTPVNKLTKEKRVLLGYARAFLRKADVYLIDDVIKDATDRDALFLQIKPLVERLADNSIVLYATDRASECEALGGKKIVFLNYGIPIRQGTYAEIKENPTDLMTVEKFLPEAEREGTVLFTDKNGIYIEAFGKKSYLSQEKLLSDIFLNKEVVVVKTGDGIKVFDQKSERLIYFG